MPTYDKIKDMVMDRIRVHSAYRRVFNTPDGEIVLRHLMKVGKVTKPTFVAGDPHLTSFREGQRHLALSILKFARSDEKDLIEQVERGLIDD